MPQFNFVRKQKHRNPSLREAKIMNSVSHRSFNSKYVQSRTTTVAQEVDVRDSLYSQRAKTLIYSILKVQCRTGKTVKIVIR